MSFTEVNLGTQNNEIRNKFFFCQTKPISKTTLNFEKCETMNQQSIINFIHFP